MLGVIAAGSTCIWLGWKLSCDEALAQQYDEWLCVCREEHGHVDMARCVVHAAMGHGWAPHYRTDLTADMLAAALIAFAMLAGVL